MKYISLCAGIEAASVAWHHMGWQPTAYSEIEPFPIAVLAHHYPDTPNWGDMTKYKEWPDAADVNVLVGGTPCQSFSVAGLRKGLDDPRGNLMLTFLAIAAKYRPQWVVWENVLGVLSSNGGRDFGAFLGGLAICGYGFAYRVLDAQYFGLAQRRRRVFVVGCLGGWQRAAAVLFERHSLSGNPAPSREKRKDITGPITAGISKGMRGTEGVDSGWAIPVSQPISFGAQMFAPQTDVDMVQTLQAKNPMAIAFSRNDDGRDATEDLAPAMRVAGRAGGMLGVAQPVPFDTTQLTSPSNYSSPQPGDPCHPLSAGAHPPAVVHHYIGGVDYENNAHAMDEPTGPLLKGSPTGGGRPLPAVATAMQVRRLTPMECERLQGFSDGYTNIPWRGKLADQCPDGPRYKALGNSMAVPVMRWIGERIQAVENIK